MKARTNVLGTIFTLLMLMASTIGQLALFGIPLAALAPAALAANGLGEVTFLSIDGVESPITQGVQTVNTEKEHVYRIHNDDPVSGNCIDEIIITYPNSWQDAIDLDKVTVTNLGAVLLSNEADDGTLSGLVNNDNSLRIVPDKSLDGVMLCPSGTTEITIGGNITAPSSPEDSTINVYTSDEDHNEPSNNPVRALLSNILPVIHVTDAEDIVIKYVDIEKFGGVFGSAEWNFNATAKGGWGRITELYFSSGGAQDVDVYVEKAGAGFSAVQDELIADNINLGAGVNTIPLTLYSGADVGFGPTAQMTDGFLKDSAQSGLTRSYYIDRVNGSGSLTLLGHADEDADDSIDPTYLGTGFTNPPKEGTVLTVNESLKRKIFVQLVKDVGGKLHNVKDDNIPLSYSTTLSIFFESGLSTATRLTDAEGQAEIRLNPGTVAGNALVETCFPDPSCQQEDVAIAPGAQVRCAITKGLNTEVEAGSIETIEATIYDQYGNVISNDPNAPLVTFDMRPPAGSSPGPDADLDDDTNPPFTGDGDQFESETAQLGIADASLQTSATVGDHEVEVKADNLDCGTTTVKGVLGQAGQVDCIVLNESFEPFPSEPGEVEADQCFNVLVHVKDANGNPLPVWESIVEFSLSDTSKFIDSTDFREELFLSPQKVQGKLNPNDPAFANVRVCGCDELGDIDILCRTDTLDDDEESLIVVNSQPTCIDVDAEGGKCSDDVVLSTSILDTCGNKVVDQQCSEGGFANSCVFLQSTCGVLSTDKTCVDLGNTGMAPNVQLDISGCACGDITVTSVDEPDCCPSVIPNEPLPQCQEGGTIINKLGPATHINLSVYPKANNQDNFWVSEKAVIDLRLLDACEQEVDCDEEKVDVVLTGEDCVNTSIQVNSPLTLEEIPHTEDECAVKIPQPLHKVVFQNCKPGSKEQGNKEWVDLPEKDDIVVDKIAFSYNGPTDNVEVCVYEETEKEAGFQSSGSTADLAWKCADLDSVPNIPFDDQDTSENAANDTIHGTGGLHDRGVGRVYLIELDDRISKFNGRNEYDNQRLGGAIVEAGDTKDFYLTIDNIPDVCGTYDIDYLYYEDYNSPDIIGWTPYNFPSTHVLDTLENTENYTRRNDDYETPDPYPVTSSTPSYGFGDTELHSLVLSGSAFVWFRDLVAETVNIFVKASLPVIFSGFPPAVADNQAEVTFLTQPATQVVALNHGDLDGDAFICDGAGFEPTIEYDPDGECQGLHDCFNESKRKCRPARACDGEGYDINLQVTDGFQNQVGLEGIEVQLDGCMEFPHFIYLGDTLFGNIKNKTIDLWTILGLHDGKECGDGGCNGNGVTLVGSDPRDFCFNTAVFKENVKKILDDEGLVGPDGEFLKSFVGSEEFDDFLSSIFDDKNVIFLDENGVEITQTDAAGHLIVTTDSNGRARIRVVSDDSSMFDVKSFDTSYRLFFTPHALDGDYFDVAFAPGTPAQWDILAVPSTGIPADGEQEAKVLIRKLDACGNPVHIDESAKVSIADDNLAGDPARAVISRDFTKNNNYVKEVVGDLNQFTCKSLFPWFEDCSLQVLSDQIEDIVVTVEDAECEGTQEGFCTGPQDAGCEAEQFQNQHACEAQEVCEWISEAICQESDSTVINFVGAPTQLKITEILHSDLIPADGYKLNHLPFDLPRDACTDEEVKECVLGGEPEICFKNCVQYGNTGAWVTVEVQDKFNNRVTGYLGDGFKKDPGDVKGNPDNVFEKICVALDDPRAFIRDDTFGWIDLSLEDVSSKGRVYCGDLAYGRGSFNVVYRMLDKHEDQPLDPRETRKVIVSVFDVCDRELFENYNGNNWKENRWDDLCNAQEYNENNLPDSETASRLNPDSNKIIFTSLPDRWDINSNKLVVAADGQDYATLEINTENEFMDIRTSVDATVQSSLLGSKLESEAITPGCYVEGIFDPVNPTSINVQTEACSGGRAKLRLSSTKPGIARVTVTGSSFGCLRTDATGPSRSDLYIPDCKEFGVIPLTPKTIEIEFKQSFQNKLELKTGWNFFSVPVELNDSLDTWSDLNLHNICDSATMWNDAAQTFVAVPLAQELDNPPMEGFWCKVSSDVTIPLTPKVLSGVVLPPTKTIYKGWNDVGLGSYVERKAEHALISIDKIYTQVLDWVEGLQRYFGMANTGELGGGEVPGTTGTNNMQAGQGYFVYTTDTGTLASLS